MAGDPMLDALRKALWPQPHDECPDSWADCNLARGFIRDHGHALLARLEAMEKAVVEEREACAAIAAEYDGPGCAHGQLAQLGDSARTRLDIAAAIRARGQS